jgi:hypothetical protein
MSASCPLRQAGKSLLADETAGRTAAVGGLEGKLKTLHAKELGEGSRGASSDLGSLAVFNVEQVALNRHVSSQLQNFEYFFLILCDYCQAVFCLLSQFQIRVCILF